MDHQNLEEKAFRIDAGVAIVSICALSVAAAKQVSNKKLAALSILSGVIGVTISNGVRRELMRSE